MIDSVYYQSPNTSSVGAGGGVGGLGRFV